MMMMNADHSFYARSFVNRRGSFEFWACRAGVGKVVFEIGGPLEIREEVAKAGEYGTRLTFPCPSSPPRSLLLTTLFFARSRAPSQPSASHQPSCQSLPNSSRRLRAPGWATSSSPRTRLLAMWLE